MIFYFYEVLGFFPQDFIRVAMFFAIFFVGCVYLISKAGSCLKIEKDL